MIRKHLRRMERDDAIEVQGGRTRTTERSAEDAVRYSPKRL